LIKVSIRMKSGRIYPAIVEALNFRNFVRDLEAAMKEGAIFFLLDDVALVMDDIEAVEPREG